MRRLSTAFFATAIAASALLAEGAVADTTINEIRTDQPSSDNDEYFELAGTPGASLTGLTYLVIGDGSAAQGSGVIETVVSLSGRSIAADGFFLVAETTFSNVFAPGSPDYTPTGGNPLNFENDDNVTHPLVSGFTGTNGQDLDTNDDGVLDVTPWTAIVDSVALFKSSAAGNEKVYSASVVGPDGPFVPGHVLRLPDGSGAWQVGNFNGGEDTPGAPNTLLATLNASIHEIQGAAHVSPLVSRKVRTRGIVTATTPNGFFLQEPAPDADPATSEGVFVFTSSAPTVVVGADVQLEGVVSEFTPGGVSTGNLSNTEILPLFVAGAITTLSTGNALPAAIVVGPSGRMPPTEVIEDDALAVFDPANDGLDFYESLEGMRVEVRSPVAASRTNDFGEIWVLAEDGAGATGRNARGGITLTAADSNPERIQIQVGDEGILAGFDPQVNVGDRLGDVTGVMDYDFGQFQVVATQTFSVTPGGLAPEVSDLVAAGDRLTVAGFNCHNLDPNDLDGDTDIADGHFDRLGRQIVDDLRSPDIVALQEIQDDSGSADDGTVGSDATLTRLVAAIVAAGGPGYSWAYLPPVNDQDGGEPGGNIRVAYLYDPSRVTFLPGSLRRLTDTDLSDGDAFFSSRKPLVGEFVFNTRHVTLIDVHCTSKGGSAPLFGRVQPPTNGGVDQRAAQATILRAEVDALLALDPDANVVVIGDFNEHDWNAPLAILEGAGPTALENLTKRHAVLERYSYVFEGNSQSLDHVFVSAALSPVVEHDIVHVNSEFAVQASDHDPQVIRLLLPLPSAAEALAFFDAGVAAGALRGVSTKSKVAANELDSFRKRLSQAVLKEEQGLTADEVDMLRSALSRIDGDTSPPDWVTGDTDAKARIFELISAALAVLVSS